jgi:hypothetical protein
VFRSPFRIVVLQNRVLAKLPQLARGRIELVDQHELGLLSQKVGKALVGADVFRFDEVVLHPLVGILRVDVCDRKEAGIVLAEADEERSVLFVLEDFVASVLRYEAIN